MSTFPLFDSPGSLNSPNQTHGFNPTQAGSLAAWQSQNTHLQAIQRAAMTAPSANMLANIFANNMIAPGDPQTARDWMQQTQAGQVTQQIAGMIAGSGIMGMGRSGDMFYGLQNMVANSGMQLGIQGQAGSPQFYGAGFLTDQMSLGIMGQLNKDFYNMGRPTYEARGLNMTDIGGIMNAAATRGVFAGERMYELERYTPETIAQDLKAAEMAGDTQLVDSLKNAQPGQNRLRLNDSSSKIKSFVQDTGDLLGDLKNMWAGMPIEQMLQQAEQLTGMGLQEAGGPQAIRARISQITSMAGAYGLNPQGVLQATSQLNQGISGQMASLYGGSPEMYRRTSAALGGAATMSMMGSRGGNMEAANVLGGHGIFVTQFSDEFRGTVAAQGGLAVMQQEFGAVEAIYAADQPGTSPENRAKLRGAVARLQNATTVEEREAARAEIDNALRESGFGGAGVQTSNYGGDIKRMTERFSPGALNDLTNLTSGVDRNSTLEYQVGDAMRTGMIYERFGLGGGDGTTNTFRTLIDNFKATTLDSIMGAGTREKRIELMVAGGMSQEAAAELEAQIGGDNFRMAFGAFQGEFRSNPMNANFQSQEQIRNAENRAYHNKAIDNSLGRNRLGKADLIQVGLAAIGGYGDGPNEANIMAYTESRGMGKTFDFNSDGGLALDMGSAESMLMRMTGGSRDKEQKIYEKMGVKDRAGFIAKVSSRKGFQAFHGMVMDDPELYGDFGSKGGFFVTGEDNFKASAGLMDSEASMALFEGFGLNGPNGLSDELKKAVREGDSSILMDKLMNDDRSGFNKKGQIMFDKAMQGDAISLGSLRYFGNVDKDTVTNALDKREAELRKEKGDKPATEEQTAEMKRIKDMRESLGKEGADEYIGVMKMIMDNEAEVSIWKTGS